jgi:hypothetical protein
MSCNYERLIGVSKMEEITGRPTKRYYEQVHKLYSSANSGSSKIKEDEVHGAHSAQER